MPGDDTFEPSKPTDSPPVDESPTKGDIPDASLESQDTVDSGAAAANRSDSGALGSPPELPGYEIIEELGRGGMGAVYLAQDTKLQRQVAVKVMKPDIADNPDARKRFLREARTLAAVEHDNIITIHSVEEAGSTLFLVTPLLKGESLRDRLNRTEMTIDEVLRIGRQIAEGLAAAHEVGLIHRDIKPANIWLEGKRGRVKILDFGLARTQKTDEQLTKSGAVVGTPAYMSPEQADGQATDARSDLFSLGCVLHHMLTGRATFQGPRMLATLSKLANHNPPPPIEENSHCPQELSDQVIQMLAKKPEDRPGSADAVAKALGRIESHRDQTMVIGGSKRKGAAQSKQPETAIAPSKPIFRRTVFIGASLLVLAALIIGGVTLTFRTKTGVIVVKLAEPDVKVFIDNEEKKLVFESKKIGKVELSAGDHTLIVKRGEEELFTKSFKLKSGGKLIIDAQWEPRVAVKPGSKKRPASPLDKLKRSDIPEEELKAAGNGDAKNAPPELVAVLGESRFRHWGRVSSVAYSPDGKRIATASYQGDRSATIWEMQTGRKLLSIRGPVLRIAFSPDGKRLAIGGDSGVLSICDAKNGKVLLNLRQKQIIGSLSFSPDGKRLASASEHNIHIWDATTGKELLVLKGHSGRVWSVAFSLDGKWLASGSADKTVKVWDAKTGKVAHTLKGHTDTVASVAFHPDSKRLASASRDKTVRLWDTVAGQEVKKLQVSHYLESVAFGPHGRLLAFAGHFTAFVYEIAKDAELCKFRAKAASRYTAIAFSPDGKQLACAGHCLEIWDLAKRQEIVQPRWHATRVNSVAFNPDGHSIASGSHAGMVIVWDAGSGREFFTTREFGTYGIACSQDGKTVLVNHGSAVKLLSTKTRQVMSKVEIPDGGILSFAFHTDSNRLATGYKTPKIWDARTGKELLNLSGHKTAVRSLAFSPDGKRLASAAKETNHGEIKIWDARSGKELVSWKRPETVWAIAFSPDGSRLATAEGNPGGKQKGAVVTISDPDTGRVVRTLSGHLNSVTSVTYSPDGKMLASSDPYGGVILWNAETGQKIRHWQFAGEVLDVAFSPDGRYLATGNGNSTIYVLKLDGLLPGANPFDQLKRADIPEEELKAAGNGDAKNAPPELVAVFGESRFRHWDAITSLAYSPDGKRLASASRLGGRTAKIWDVKTGRELLSLTGHREIQSVTFSPDGNQLATGGAGIKIWNTQTGEELHHLIRNTISVAFSPDGKRLVSGGYDHTMHIWDATAGKELHSLKGHTKGLLSVAYSPDGKWLASGSLDKTVKVWDAKTGKELHTLKGHSDAVTCIAFHPDSKRLVSGSRDKMVRIWDVITGEEKKRLNANYEVTSASFGPEGKLLAFVALNRTLTVYNLFADAEFCRIAAPSGPLAFSPVGKRVACGGRLQIWDLATQKETVQPQGHTGMIRSIAVSPDGRALASGDFITLITWDTATGAQRSMARARCNNVAYSPNGKLMASSDKVDGVGDLVKLWDAKTGKEIQTFRAHQGYVFSLAFHPDSKRLASGSGDKTVKIWDSTTGKELFNFRGHTNAVNSLAFSPDGKRLASAGKTHRSEIKIWEANSGKELIGWNRPQHVWSIAFSPDGKHLAAAEGSHGKAGMVTISDPASGKVLRTLSGHTVLVKSVSYSPDGKLLASSDYAGGVILWDADTGKKIHHWKFAGQVLDVAFSSDGRYLITGNGNSTIYVLRLGD